MGNGAFRLTARLDGRECRATVSHKSARGREIAERGGVKMSQEWQRHYVEELLLPRVLEDVPHVEET